jgi:hypothetical protein
VRPARKADGGSQDNERPNDLLYGVSPIHIRTLCSSPFDGRYGYDPNTVANFTLDQIFMLLCDKNTLRSGGKNRIEKVSSLAALGTVDWDQDGKIRGVSASGKPMKAEIKGKSKARILMEAEEQRKAKEAEKERLSKKASQRKTSSRIILKGENH